MWVIFLCFEKELLRNLFGVYYVSFAQRENILTTIQDMLIVKSHQRIKVYIVFAMILYLGNTKIKLK